jgi:hypothetical protein
LVDWSELTQARLKDYAFCMVLFISVGVCPAGPLKVNPLAQTDEAGHELLIIFATIAN